MDSKIDKKRNFEVVRHVLNSDRYWVHKDDLAKIGTQEKVGVYEFDSKGFKASTSSGKGVYFHPFRVFIGRYLQRLSNE